MDASLVINMVALVLSLLAIATSAVLALRQSKLMQHANLSLILTNLFEQFRAAEFKLHMAYLEEELWKAQPPTMSRLRNLPQEARTHATTVAGFFNAVGVLVAHHVIDEELVVSYMGRSVRLAWGRLEPYIRNERQHINDPIWNGYFEHLAFLTMQNSPEKLDARLRLGKMPISSIKEADTKPITKAEA
jgi:hypothetical protein